MKLPNIVNLEALSDQPYDHVEVLPRKVTIIEHSSDNVRILKKRQRLQVFALCLLSMVTGLNLFTFSSSTTFLSAHFGITEESVELLSSVYFLFHAIFGLFLGFLARFFGFKTSFVTTSILYIMGQIIVSVGMSLVQETRSLFLVIVGQILNAIGFAVIIETPTTLADAWRDKAKAPLETSFFTAMLLGVTIKQSISGALVQNGFVMSQVLPKVILCKAAVAFFALLLAIPVFCIGSETAEQHQSLLAIAPKPTQTIRRFLSAVQLSYMDINFLLVTQSYAINYASVASMFTFLHSSITQETAQNHAMVYWIESAFALGGILGLLSGSFLSQRVSKTKFIGATSMFLSAVFGAAFTFTLTRFKSESLSIVCLTAWGITTATWLAIGILHTRKVSRLPAADIPHTACLVAGSLYTVILIAFGGWMKKNYGFLAIGYLISCLQFLGFILTAMSREVDN